MGTVTGPSLGLTAAISAYGCFAHLLRFFFGLFNEHARLTAEDRGLLAEDSWSTGSLSDTRKSRLLACEASAQLRFLFRPRSVRDFEMKKLM